MIDVLKEAAEIARRQKEYADEITAREQKSLTEARQTKSILWAETLASLQQFQGQECPYGKFILRGDPLDEKMSVWVQDFPPTRAFQVLRAWAEVNTGAANDDEDYSYPIIFMEIFSPNIDGQAKGKTTSLRHKSHTPAFFQFMATYIAPWMSAP